MARPVLGVIFAVLVAVAVGVGLSVSFISGGGPGPGEEIATPAEPFRAFPNQTGYPDSVLWEGYRYARVNPQVLGYIPCFCGCVHHGDTSNFGCYVDEIRPDGSVRYDPHASG